MAKIKINITTENGVVLSILTVIDTSKNDDLGQIMLSNCITNIIEHKFETIENE